MKKNKYMVSLFIEKGDKTQLFENLSLTDKIIWSREKKEEIEETLRNYYSAQRIEFSEAGFEKTK